MTKTKIEQPQTVTGAFDELLSKMYISNVQNRLRQLNEPSENDSKRWLWELIQNAKDSVVQLKDRQSVDIRIQVRGQEVKIKHNGAPFTAKAQLGLLYKYSEGKVNSSESTGRFGTGFLTTHVLSKIVSIEGDLYTDDNNSELCGFSATMYRDGLDEHELLDGVNKMKKSIEFTEELNGWTCYTYYLKTPHNEKALHLGIENFFDNIAQTMLFCKELESIELDNNGVITSIHRMPYKLLKDDIYSTSFDIKGEKEYSRTFIHTSLKRVDDKLSQRFKTERSVRLTMAIEVDDKSLVENTSSPSHFCVLPLVGSEKHIMPVYLNSPDFEPDSERESLILIGDDILPDKGVISEGGINRLLIYESIDLFDKLVRFLSENKYENLYYLAKGLKSSPKFEKNFNKEWFKTTVTNGYRDILKKYPIVETKMGYQELFDNDGSANIRIPKESDNENQSRLYNLVKMLFPENVPSENTFNEWAKYAWKECGIFNTEDLAKFVSGVESLENLKIENTDKFEWINNLLSFIKQSNELLLSEHEIIPNRKGQFVSLSNDSFAEGIELTAYMTDCLKELGNDLDKSLLHNRIDSISIPLKINSKEIANKINEEVMTITKESSDTISIIKKLLPIINTVPNNTELYELEFIAKQSKINSYIKILFPDAGCENIVNNDIPQRAWREAHTWLLEIIVKSVHDLKNIEALPDTILDKVQFINDFIGFVSKQVLEGVLDEFAIIPNQNGDFCPKSKLSKDVNIPEELKSKEAEEFGLVIKKDLLHKSITSINISSEKNINNVIQMINDKFENSLPEGKDKLQFAIFITHLLPEESSPLLSNSQNKLLEIIRKYYHNRSSQHTSKTISCSSEGLWTKATRHIISNLTRHIEGKIDIEGLQKILSESGVKYDFGDTIIFLNDVYDFLKSSNIQTERKIIPNQNGIFFSSNDNLYLDNNIPTELKDILCLIDKNNDFREILAESSLSESILPSHKKSLNDIASVIDKRINDLYSHSSNWENEKFIEAIEKLMIDWFPKNKELAKEYFTAIFRKKETIEMNVLWSLEERLRMQKARKINPDLLDKFINDAINIESLEIEKNKLLKEIQSLKLEKDISNINSNIEDIAKEFPNITADEIRELVKIKEKLNSWNGEYENIPFTAEEKHRNFINGYKGEAYVYKELKESGVFKNIRWEHKSDEATDLSIIDYKGEKHFIKENYSKYDLVAETYDDKLFYIEVKSTRTSLSNTDKISLPISRREWKFVDEITKDENYCLARVFEVENNPEGHYLVMKGIGVSNIN